MLENLRSHMDMLFENAPKTRAAFELKEELTANSIERYNDLLEDGFSEEDAYQNVIGSIGNVADLFGELEIRVEAGPADDGTWRRKSALILSVAIGLFIVAGIVLVAGTIFYDPIRGFLGALAVCLVPVCMVVYRGVAYPKYRKPNENVVEDFREWSHHSPKKQAMRGVISSIIWLACLILYFLISFGTGAWYITWVLFLVAACVEAVVTLLMQIKELN